MKSSFRIILLAFLFANSFTALALANGTVKANARCTQTKKQPTKACQCLPPCACPDEEICPIGCPCPESWMGGALEPCNTPPQTETCEITCCFNDGFYVGGQVGYLNAQHKYNANLSGLTSGNFSKTKNQSTVSGGVLLGGRYFVCPQFFVGAEISGNIDASSTRFFLTGNFGETYTHKCKRRFSIVPTAVIGYAFAQTFATYVKLGADISKYRTSIAVNLFGLSQSFKKEATKTVFLPAIGVEYCFSPSISSRIEVSHNFNAPKLSMSNRPIRVTNDDWTVKVKNTLVNVGVLFKF